MGLDMICVYGRLYFHCMRPENWIWIKFCGRYRWMLIGNNSWPNTHKCAEQLQLEPIVYASNVDFKVATVRPVHTLSVVAVNGPPPLVTRSINTTTISLHPFGTSYRGKQHGAVVVKAGLCLIMSVAPDRVNHYSLGWIDKVPLHPTLPIDALGFRLMAPQPLRHYISTPHMDHPFHPRIQKWGPTPKIGFRPTLLTTSPCVSIPMDMNNSSPPRTHLWSQCSRYHCVPVMSSERPFRNATNVTRGNTTWEHVS